MGPRALTRAAIALGALAPAAVWLAPPAPPLLAVVLLALAVTAALHGLGRAVGSLVGDDDAPFALAVAWGLAAYLALGGWLAAAGVFDQLTQRAVLVAGTAVGAAWSLRHTPASLPRPRLRLALVAPILAAAVVVVHLFGAAGWWQGGFFDGEAHLLGPLGRLATAGDLADPFALPRTTGLGGTTILHSLAGVLGDWRMGHAIDRGLGFALVVALAFRAAPLGPARVLALFAIVVLASGMAEYNADLAPRWTPIALVFALHQTLARRPSSAPRDAVPAVLLAAALATMRHGGLGALVLIAVVTAADTERGRRGQAVALAGLVSVLVLGGYLVAAVAAFAGEPAAPDAIAILWRGAAIRLALWTTAGLAAYSVARVALRGCDDRALVITIAAVCATIALAGPLAPPRSAWLTVQPLAIALVLLAIAPLLESTAGRAVPSPRALIAVVGVTLALGTLRSPTGRPPLSWDDRLVRLVDGARALVHRSPRHHLERADYDRAVRALPRGARVGLWVDRPDLVDYRGRSIVDLRSPSATACTRLIPRFSRRFHRPLGSCRRLAALLPRLDLDYLVVAATALPRPDASIDRPWCHVLTPLDCVDPITRFVGLERRRGAPGLDVVDLRAGR